MQSGVSGTLLLLPPVLIWFSHNHDLMSGNYDLYNKNGTFNDRGYSVQGLHAINYDVYMRQVQEYADAIKQVNADLAEDPNNIKLTDRYNELLKLQRYQFSSNFLTFPLSIASAREEESVSYSVTRASIFVFCASMRDW